MRYRYVPVNDPGVPGGSVPGTNLYLQSVTDTGSVSQKASTRFPSCAIASWRVASY